MTTAPEESQCYTAHNVHADAVSQQYEPFRDADKQIRLLTFDVDSISALIAVSLTVYNLDDAPAYTALSYTWGEPGYNTPITLNGHAISVRPNCEYALQQLRALGSFQTLYWIDAICIDQENLAEKGPQVGIMGKIYGQADEVVVCYGRDTDNTAWLLATLEADPGLVGLDFMRNGEVRGSDDTSYLAHPLSETYTKGFLGQQCLCDYRPDRRCRQHFSDSRSIRKQYGSRLLDALEAIGSYAYWHRLWILQELVLANRVMLLHRTGLLPFETLYYFIEIIKPMLPLLLDRSVMDLLSLQMVKIGDMLYAHRQHNGPDFDDLAKLSEHMRCSVLLDRLYAIIYIAKWPIHKLRLVPDYTISPVQLALRYLSAHSAEERGRPGPIDLARSVVACLGITGMEPEMMELTRECQHSCALYIDPNLIPLPRTTIEPMAWDTCTLPGQRVRSCEMREMRVRVLGSPGTARLAWAPTVSSRWSEDVNTASPGIEEFTSAANDSTDQCDIPTLLPAKQLLQDGELVGHICPTAEDGDLIMEQHPGLGIVLRPSRANPNVYAIVGYADIRENLVSPFHSPMKESWILDFESQDLLVLAVLLFRQKPVPLRPSHVERQSLVTTLGNRARSPISSIAWNIDLLPTPKTWNRFGKYSEWRLRS